MGRTVPREFLGEILGSGRQPTLRRLARDVELGPASHAVDVGGAAPDLALMAAGLREPQVDVQHRRMIAEPPPQAVDAIDAPALAWPTDDDELRCPDVAEAFHLNPAL